MFDLLLIFTGIIIGSFFSTQAAINTKLTSYAKSPFPASFISFLIGTIILFFASLALAPNSLLSINFSYPTYIFLGGAVSGVLFHAINTMLFIKLGASLTSILTLTGQIIIGTVIDHLGLFNIPAQETSWSRALGILIMITAVIIAKSHRNASEKEISKKNKKWVLFGLLAGFLPPLQSAINSQLSLNIGSVVVAAFISFLVGTILLAIILLVKHKSIKIPLYNAQHKRLPLWLYSAGIFGTMVVAGNILVIQGIGSVLATITLLSGQLIMATLIDYFGFFGVNKEKITLRRIVAIILIIVSLFFI